MKMYRLPQCATRCSVVLLLALAVTEVRGQAGARRPVAPASARGSASNVRDVRSQIDAVYQLAASATNVQQIQQALQQCERLATMQLDRQNSLYLRQLQAWLINRRGEACALAASRYAEAGRDAEALKWEQKAADDFDASLQLDAQWRPHHNRGVSLAMLGKYDEALAHFATAIEMNPTYPNTRFNRAELWLEMGEYALAEQEYTEVLTLASDDPDARVGRGHTRFYLGEFDQALADFNAAIQQRPEYAVAYADRADLHAYLGNWDQAAQDYRTALGLDRSLGRAYQSAAWLMATCPDARYRDDQLALRAAQRAIELDGTQDYRYLDTLAAAQANAGRFAEANQTLDQAMAVAPADVQPELKGRKTLYVAQQAYRDTSR